MHGRARWIGRLEELAIDRVVRGDVADVGDERGDLGDVCDEQPASLSRRSTFPSACLVCSRMSPATMLPLASKPTCPAVTTTSPLTRTGEYGGSSVVIV